MMTLLFGESLRHRKPASLGSFRDDRGDAGPDSITRPENRDRILTSSAAWLKWRPEDNWSLMSIIQGR
jgi:hypothetical protein